MRNSYTAFIPARGGSKSIPLKNIKMLGGRPMICWCIEAALESERIDRVVVSTDSARIETEVSDYFRASPFAHKLSFFSRSPETASDTASTESAILDFHRRQDYDHLILIQATSPLLTTADLDAGIEGYESAGWDSLLSAVRQKRFLWEWREDSFAPINYDYFNRPRRQDFEGYYVENGSFYITSRAAFERTGCRISGKVGISEMEENTYLEIDEPSDWPIVEALLLQRQRTGAVEKDIQLVVTDCDGVMTDGGMYYTEAGDEAKKFNTKDGMGIELLRKRGIKTCIITGEDSQIVRRRAEKLKIDYVFTGIKDKYQVLSALIDELGLELSQVAYLGDDINDVDCIRVVGMGCAVRDAIPCVREAAVVVLESKGGEGAVRELADYICAARD